MTPIRHFTNGLAAANQRNFPLSLDVTTAYFKRANRLWPLEFLFLMLATGCSSRPETPNLPPGHNELLAISSIVEQFRMKSRGQPPQNEVEFKNFVTTYGGHLLEPYGIRDPSQLFISPRDLNPFVILYGSEYGKFTGPGGAVVAYEAVGLNGARLVAFQAGAVQELSANEFNALTRRPK